jgi:hypothetical protein
MAAQGATKTAIKLARSDAADLVSDLERMRDEASETERRCKRAAEGRKGGDSRGGARDQE